MPVVVLSVGSWMLMTNYMQQTSWKAKSNWDTQEIPCISMELKRSLPFPQQHATYPYSKPGSSSPHFPILFL